MKGEDKRLSCPSSYLSPAVTWYWHDHSFHFRHLCMPGRYISFANLLPKFQTGITPGHCTSLDWLWTIDSLTLTSIRIRLGTFSERLSGPTPEFLTQILHFWTPMRCSCWCRDCMLTTGEGGKAKASFNHYGCLYSHTSDIQALFSFHLKMVNRSTYLKNTIYSYPGVCFV